MVRFLLVTAFAFAAIATPLAGALADRAPTAEERTQIETALRAAGYTSWQKIEFDDDKWEVDDAVAADGKKYDLDLDKKFKILKSELDD